MAVHEIRLAIKKGIEVVNTDVKFVVKRDGDTFGTLTISKGSIDWRPKKKHAGGKNETSLGWSQFDEVMRNAKG